MGNVKGKTHGYYVETISHNISDICADVDNSMSKLAADLSVTLILRN